MKKYQFTKLKLTYSERIWLEKIYSYDFRIVDEKTVKVSLANELEKGFDHKKIDYSLLRDNRLTLLGIWYVDSKNKYYDIVPRIVCLLKEMIKDTNFNFRVSVKDIFGKLQISESEISIAFMLMWDLGIFSGGKILRNSGMDEVNISSENGGLDKILYFKNIYEVMEEYFIRSVRMKTSNVLSTKNSIFNTSDDPGDIWVNIKKEFSLTKKEFGKRINFIEDDIARKIIFRDVEHAYYLLKKNINKPAIILAGSIMEEILRQLLLFEGIKSKNESFDDYIKTCELNKLLSISVSRLSDSSRLFRNYVHISKEINSIDRISNSVANAAVSALFVLVYGLKHKRKKTKMI